MAVYTKRLTHPSPLVILFEKSSTGPGAYAPDLPGFVATGRALEETRGADGEGEGDAAVRRRWRMMMHSSSLCISRLWRRVRSAEGV